MADRKAHLVLCAAPIKPDDYRRRSAICGASITPDSTARLDRCQHCEGRTITTDLSRYRVRSVTMLEHWL